MYCRAPGGASCGRDATASICSAGCRSLARCCAGSSRSACCRSARRRRSASRRLCSRPCCRSKEKVGIHRWSALIVGFGGVLIITHPGAGTLTYGALFALGNAVLISTVAIAIRRMSMTESAETLTLYQMSMMTLCTAGLLTLGFQAPHLGDALMLALAGVGNGIAQFWWTRSLSLAPPSAVVPFNYLSLVWAMILGFAVWGDVPTPALLAGSAIVVASGAY
ncbi:MAG TPA: DMT family transporter, partial [Stellaceae bacterium]